MKKAITRSKTTGDVRTASALTTRPSTRGKVRCHKVSVCSGTGLPRYRDRHQARQAAAAAAAGDASIRMATFACPQCRGFHLEPVRTTTLLRAPAPAPCEAFTASLSTRKRRYVICDIENLTRGARATAVEAAAALDLVKEQAPGIAPGDHVVVGASRNVARRYRAAIHGDNVRWVVGPNGRDGADRALLAAINVHSVARDYDELVIISGDHAFAGLARAARALGLTVHVVSVEDPRQSSTLSRELSAAATTRSRVRLRSRSQHRSNITAMASVARAAHRGSAAA